jgi:hypothetical protein
MKSVIAWRKWLKYRMSIQSKSSPRSALLDFKETVWAEAWPDTEACRDLEAFGFFSGDVFFEELAKLAPCV